MRICRIKSAIAGEAVWRKYIIPFYKQLVLVIPDYDEKLLEVLMNVFPDYLVASNCYCSKVVVVYCDNSIKNKMTGATLFHYCYIDKKKMDYLVCFMRFSMKQYGAVNHKNVKLISIEENYGGQLAVLVQSGLFDLKTIVYDNLLVME